MLCTIGCSARLGDPVALLPVLNHVLFKYSPRVARAVIAHGFEVCWAVFLVTWQIPLGVKIYVR